MVVQKVAKEIPLSQMTLRKYEKPRNLSKRELVKKVCLSLGLLQPGDSRDVIVDILVVLLRHRKGLTIKYVRRMKHTYPRAIAMVADGLVDVDRLVTHRFPLDHVAQGYRLVSSREDGVMKVVIEIAE